MQSPTKSCTNEIAELQTARRAGTAYNAGDEPSTSSNRNFRILWVSHQGSRLVTTSSIQKSHATNLYANWQVVEYMFFRA